MQHFERITSRENPKISRAKKVREGLIGERIFVEGTRLLREAIRSDVVIEAVFISANLGDEPLAGELARRGYPVYMISAKIASGLSDTVTSQGVFAIAHKPRTGEQEICRNMTLADLPIVVLLNEANNPSNLGAVIRSAEAAGAAGLITTPRSASAFSPKALRASMGSAFRLPIWEGIDLQSAAAWAASSHLQISAATGKASTSYLDLDWKAPRLVILGSEAHGLTPEQLAVADESIFIEMNAEVESLNLAVAASVILFEARRQIKAS
jgi:RNA methyltransferase, TrmH family